MLDSLGATDLPGRLLLVDEDCPGAPITVDTDVGVLTVSSRVSVGSWPVLPAAGVALTRPGCVLYVADESIVTVPGRMVVV